MEGKLCSTCRGPRDRPGQRLCRACHRAYIREWRRNNPESYGKKERVRGLVRSRIKRGYLERGQCVICGAENAEAHHPDYDKPLEIVWLCHRHHREHHRRGLSLPQGSTTVLPIARSGKIVS